MKFVTGFSVFFIAAAPVFFSSCSSAPSLPSGQHYNSSKAAKTSEEFLLDDSNVETEKAADQEIRPGNLIRIASKADEQLNGDFRVSFDGELRLPYNTTLKTADMNLSELNKKINDSYRSLYKKGAQISTSIADRKFYVEVRGLVQKPGLLLVKRREKIEDIIKRSGDMAPNTNEGRLLQVVRGKNTYYVNLTEYFQGQGINKSPIWYGGEKVFFVSSASALGNDEASASIHFLGDVRTPGVVSFQEKSDIFSYLVKVGGTTSTSDLDRVRVTRMTPEGRFVAYGSAEEIAKHIQLEPGDTVLMGSSLPGKYERNIQLGTLLATIISTLGILIIAL